jgi:hypothetical protein
LFGARWPVVGDHQVCDSSRLPCQTAQYQTS